MRTRRHRRKILRLRGTRTNGRGNAKRGRGKGSRKGRGSVKSYGGGYRNFMFIAKYEPWRLNKKGFYSHRKKERGINLKEVEKLCEKNKNDIDVTKYGYDKVLGSGDLKRAIEVKAHSFSKKAKERIEKAGGKAIIIGKGKGEKVE